MQELTYTEAYPVHEPKGQFCWTGPILYNTPDDRSFDDAGTNFVIMIAQLSSKKSINGCSVFREKGVVSLP